MPFLPPSDSAKNQATGENIVAAVSKCLFQRHNGKIHVVCQQVKAEHQGGEIGGKEDADKVGQRVVVVGDESIRSGNGVLPPQVVIGKERIWMMQNVAMEDIAQDLPKRDQQCVAEGDGLGQPTSRRKRPRIKSRAIAQGIGKLVLIFRALRMCSILVKSSSTLDCMATPSSTLAVLTRAIFHHRPLEPPCSSPVGKAVLPCSLTLAAILGTAASKAKKPKAGSR